MTKKLLVLIFFTVAIAALVSSCGKSGGVGIGGNAIFYGAGQ